MTTDRAGPEGTIGRRDPYLIAGPALISFSGGRTSAYMLHQILKAHGGQLPPDVHVVFANTGKEREETLRFVHECASRWHVDVHWVEWRREAPGFEEVGYNSASRAGEPFAALIASKQRLPNWQERWCTEYLKVRPIRAFMAARGLAGYTEVIGLRDDEGMRILKGLENADRDGRTVSYPLAKAKRTVDHVKGFWSEQPFDLQLQPHEGNCDLCFLKGRRLRKRIIRDHPDRAGWWITQEREQEGTFDKRDSFDGLLSEVRASPSFFDPPDDFEHDAECGLTCAP